MSIAAVTCNAMNPLFRTQNGLELIAYRHTERGEARILAITIEQPAAKLLFQPLDGTGQCRLGYSTRTGGRREVQALGQFQKMAYLGYVHGY